jgi:hypothetical protein
MWRPADARLQPLVFGLLAVMLMGASASTPSPSPTAGAAASSSRLQGPAGQEQTEFHAYVSAVTIDGAGLMAALIQLRSCHDSRDACRRSIQQASDQVTGFQADLDRTPAPACLANVDTQLRSALSFYGTGLGLVRTGGDHKEQLKVIQGGILIGVGTWRFNMAIRDARHSSC